MKSSAPRSDVRSGRLVSDKDLKKKSLGFDMGEEDVDFPSGDRCVFLSVILLIVFVELAGAWVTRSN